ncbi:MAG: hypothetical protein AAGA54_12365 [Myxococcota bacterium]
MAASLCGPLGCIGAQANSAAGCAQQTETVPLSALPEMLRGVDVAPSEAVLAAEGVHHGQLFLGDVDVSMPPYPQPLLDVVLEVRMTGEADFTTFAEGEVQAGYDCDVEEAEILTEVTLRASAGDVLFSDLSSFVWLPLGQQREVPVGGLFGGADPDEVADALGLDSSGWDRDISGSVNFHIEGGVNFGKLFIDSGTGSETIATFVYDDPVPFDE